METVTKQKVQNEYIKWTCAASYPASDDPELSAQVECDRDFARHMKTAVANYASRHNVQLWDDALILKEAGFLDEG